MYFFFFFFNDTATTEIYTLSLHDALPISWPDGVTNELSAMFWALNGATRTPRRCSRRHSPVTTWLFPVSLPVPHTMSAPRITPTPLRPRRHGARGRGARGRLVRERRCAHTPGVRTRRSRARRSRGTRAGRAAARPRRRARTERRTGARSARAHAARRRAGREGR